MLRDLLLTPPLAAMRASCCSRSRSRTDDRPRLFHLTSTEQQHKQ